jgi:hypothetical protein
MWLQENSVETKNSRAAPVSRTEEETVLKLLVWLWRKNNKHVTVHARIPAHPAHVSREVPRPARI